MEIGTLKFFKKKNVSSTNLGGQRHIVTSAM